MKASIGIVEAWLHWKLEAKASSAGAEIDGSRLRLWASGRLNGDWSQVRRRLEVAMRRFLVLVEEGEDMAEQQEEEEAALQFGLSEIDQTWIRDYYTLFQAYIIREKIEI